MELAYRPGWPNLVSPIVPECLRKDALERANRQCYVPGQIILSPGTEHSRVHYVCSGRVKVSIFGADGHEKVLAILGPGVVVGEVMGMRLPHAVTITAFNKDTRTLAWTETEVRRLVYTYPEAAVLLIQSLANKVRLLLAQVESLSFDTSCQRISRCLLNLGEIYGEPSEEGIRIPFRLTQTELATMASVSRVTASKVCGTLKDQGVVTKKRGRFHILNMSSLENCVQRAVKLPVGEQLQR